MAKATATKRTATRRRRERKNIERGAAHIQSTFNNTIVTITDTQATPFRGLRPVGLASAVRARALRSLLQTARRGCCKGRPWSMALRRSRCS